MDPNLPNPPVVSETPTKIINYPILILVLILGIGFGSLAGYYFFQSQQATSPNSLDKVFNDLIIKNVAIQTEVTAISRDNITFKDTKGNNRTFNFGQVNVVKLNPQTQEATAAALTDLQPGMKLDFVNLRNEGSEYKVSNIVIGDQNK